MSDVHVNKSNDILYTKGILLKIFDSCFCFAVAAVIRQKHGECVRNHEKFTLLIRDLIREVWQKKLLKIAKTYLKMISFQEINHMIKLVQHNVHHTIFTI